MQLSSMFCKIAFGAKKRLRRRRRQNAKRENKKDLKGANAPFEVGPRPNTFWKSDYRPKEKAYPTEKKAHENLSS